MSRSTKRRSHGDGAAALRLSRRAQPAVVAGRQGLSAELSGDEATARRRARSTSSSPSTPRRRRARSPPANCPTACAPSPSRPARWPTRISWPSPTMPPPRPAALVTGRLPAVAGGAGAQTGPESVGRSDGADVARLDAADHARFDALDLGVATLKPDELGPALASRIRAGWSARDGVEAALRRGELSGWHATGSGVEPTSTVAADRLGPVLARRPAAAGPLARRPRWDRPAGLRLPAGAGRRRLSASIHFRQLFDEAGHLVTSATI